MEKYGNLLLDTCYLFYYLLAISSAPFFLKKLRIIPMKARRQEGSQANKKSRRLLSELIDRKEIAT